MGYEASGESGGSFKTILIPSLSESPSSRSAARFLIKAKASLIEESVKSILGMMIESSLLLMAWLPLVSK
jgi:hypothetical protein